MLGNFLLRTAKWLNVIITVELFSFCWSMHYAPELGRLQFAEYIAVVSLLYMIVIIWLNRIYNALMVGIYRISQLIYSQSLTVTLSAALAYLVVVVINLRFVSPLPLIVLVIVQIIWAGFWCVVTNRMYFALNKPAETVVIYCQDSELKRFEEIKHFDEKYRVIKYIKAPHDSEQILEELQDAKVVFASGIEMDLRNALAKHCIYRGIQCYIQPRIGDIVMAGAEHMQMFSVPIMRVQKANAKPEYLFIKRLIDIIASLLAIIITSPFMLITALAIKLYDHGPVLYKQVRLTKDYKEFKILKFRSMRTDAEKDGVAKLSTKNDDRITPIGKIIRKIRFDELPQLFNILKGDMTIVGPRPERPEIAAQYEEEIPSFGLRLQVKAGLTGYAQIYGKYNTEPYDKLKMDLMYINHMSLIEDLRLMLATVKILFVPESTEGIEGGQTTALHQEAVEVEELQSV